MPRKFYNLNRWLQDRRRSLHLDRHLEGIVVRLLSGRNDRPVAREERLSPEDSVGALGGLRRGQHRGKRGRRDGSQFIAAT